MASDPIRINRAPVLTLWASIVAERLGARRDTALTLGQAVAGMTAYSKGVRLGIYAPPEDRPHEPPPPKPAGVTSVRQHLERLAQSTPADKLNERAFRLYEKLRPEIPEDERGWGAKGILNPAKIDALNKG